MTARRSMKLHYYAETDSLYIELQSGPGVEMRVVVEGVYADLDAEGGLVGLDIGHASRLDLSTPETSALSVKTMRAAWGHGEDTRELGDNYGE